MYRLIIKRLLDLMIALSIFFIFFIPFVVIALLIKYTSAGPIFFKQKRVGKGGVHFFIYKFRTMVEDAESIGPYSTGLNDPRITKVGDFLRKTSLDELPQVLNMINGTMSFIGPRPDLEIQKINYTEDQWNERNLVRPGITGLAQVKYRSSATLEQRVDADLDYVRRYCFVLDIKITLDTLLVVLLQKHSN